LSSKKRLYEDADLALYDLVGQKVKSIYKGVAEPKFSAAGIPAEYIFISLPRQFLFM
jgi:hypothetical protein